MKLCLTTLIAALILAGCSSLPEGSEEPSARDYLAGYNGCFILFNMKTQTIEKILGGEVCKEPMTPASSFKVPLAVIGFDSGILKDENTVFKWDGVRDEREVANRDHSAKTWISDSIVWYSQRLTTKLGKKKFQKYLNDFNYGNKDLSNGITTAWLTPASSDSPALKISAFEQLEFMKKLWNDQLPVSKRAMQLTRDITYLETSPKGYRLNGKTGSSYYDEEKMLYLGWFIAHIQNGDDEYITITNISNSEPTTTKMYGGPQAKAVTKEILRSEGLW